MVDFAFKFIFGSEQNKDILIDFLNATINGDETITNITLLNPFNMKEYIDDKLSILDVKAQLDNGTFVNVEVQLLNQKDMKNRTLYYWSKLYSSQLSESENYFKLKKTIAINILNFVLLDETQKYHTTYHLQEDKEGFQLTELMEIHMIEIPKLMHSCESLDDKLVDWLLFLENPENKNMEVLTMKNPKIKKAMTVLEFISSDKRARELYEARQKEIRDRAGQLLYAKKEGKKETAVEMLKDGVDIAIIQKYTKLERNEILALNREFEK
jgi:predicted transposase/invertase (TIGR01784 family)